MATVSGEVTFIVKNQETGDEGSVLVKASELLVERDQTDTDDTHRREDVHLHYRGDAFDGAVTFNAARDYDIFGPNMFSDSGWYCTSDKEGYAVTAESNEGLRVDSVPIDINETH